VIEELADNLPASDKATKNIKYLTTIFGDSVRMFGRLKDDRARLLEPINVHEFNTEPAEVVCPTVFVVGGGPSPQPAIQK
jgi:hypothetical protein